MSRKISIGGPSTVAEDTVSLCINVSMEVPVLWLRIQYFCVLMSVWRSQYCG